MYSLHRNRRPILLALIFLIIYAWKSSYFARLLWGYDDWEEIRSDHGAKRGTSKIAKVSVAINAVSGTRTTVRCLRSHRVHNKMHGYQHFIATTPLIREEEGPTTPTDHDLGTWTKPTYLLQILLNELSKPAEERLEWLFWFDVDTIIINPHIRLETFVPPGPSHPIRLDNSTTGTNHPDNTGNRFFSSIHLLLSEDRNGINAGVFPLRVHPWSITLLTTMLSYNAYHLSEEFLLKDQPVMDHVLHYLPSLSQNWTSVPQRWFNAFPVNSDLPQDGPWRYDSPMMPEDFDDGTEDSPATDTTSSFIDVRGRNTMDQHRQQPWKIMKGDMVVSFTGTEKRAGWIESWADRAEMYLPEWSGLRFQKKLEIEARDFWKDWQEDILGKEKQRKEEEEAMKDEGKRITEALRRAGSNSERMRLSQELLARRKKEQLEREKHEAEVQEAEAQEKERQEKEKMELEQKIQQEKQDTIEDGREEQMGEKMSEAMVENPMRDEQHAKEQTPASPAKRKPSKRPKPHSQDQQHRTAKPHSNNRQQSRHKRPVKNKQTTTDELRSNNKQSYYINQHQQTKS